MTRDAIYISKIKHPKTLMMICVFVAIICLSFIGKEFGVIGIDSDDKLRFLQIRDHLRGQSWFDTDQYRMGLGAMGTDMHWSRLPDIPIILLAHFFDIFVSQDKALNLAISIWPPMSGVILFAALLIGAENIQYEGDRKHLRIFIILLAGILVLSNFRFRSGAIDHHNIQFGFVAMAMVMAMDMKMRFSRYLLAGLATAISIAIGPEVYLFAAVICGFIAFNWAVKGETAALGTQGFGVGLALGLVVIFIGTVPPSNYGIVYCDALSLITIIAAMTGGLGLAFTTKVSRYFDPNDSLIRRIMALVGLGVICLVVLSFQAPQCLSNPLSALPSDVLELWLGNISEARHIYTFTKDWPMFVPLVLGPLLVALLAFSYRYYEKYKASSHITQLWDTDVLILLLLLTTLAMTIYQIRFAPFAYVFAILPLGRWVTQSYQAGLIKGGTNVKYIACLAVSIPIIWAMPGSVFVEGNETSSNTSNTKQVEVDDDICLAPDVMAALNDLPAGLITTSSNFTGPILIDTQHRVVSGNYHRNWKGISAEIKISISSPDVAHTLLTENEIDYLYYCKDGDTIRYAKHNPEGLKAKLLDGEIPKFLVPVIEGALTDDLADSNAMIFKVIPKK